MKRKPTFYPTLGQYIDGIWHHDATNGVLPVIDPATEGQIATLPKVSSQQLRVALAAADAAHQTWSATPVTERAAILEAAAGLLRERADHIACVITREQGKTSKEAHDEVLRACNIITWNARAAVELLGDKVDPNAETPLTVYHPVGPVAAFTPWNVPLMSPARKVSMALAAGCSCILKPAEDTPGAAVELVRALVDAGLPAGVLNLVMGDPGHISDLLVRSPIIRKVTFTGSVPIGKHVAALAGSLMKPVTMELGGHNPVLILDDVDIVKVAKLAARGKFRNTGQVCTSPTRFYVHRSKYDEFVRVFAAESAALKIGSGTDPDVQLGPVVNERRLQAISQLVDETVEKGATVVTGGHRVGTEGYFYAPTILTDVDAQSSFMLQEPFGPVAAVFPFDTVEEGIALCNDSALGLAAYVFSDSRPAGLSAAARMESGVVGFNSFSVARPDVPFGGIKDSGYGREGGLEGIKAFLVTRTVV